MKKKKISQEKKYPSKTIMRRFLALFLSCALVVNICGIVISAVSDVQTDYSTMKKNIMDKAINYLNTQKNDDGSYGDKTLINDTADAVYLLRSSGANTDSLTALVSNRITCLDEAAQLAVATSDPSYLTEYIKDMKEDGSFGLTPDYSGDTYDTALTLFALSESGSKKYSGTVEKSSKWLTGQQRSDGSYAYNENSEGSISLTSLCLSAMSKLRDSKILPEESSLTLAKSAEYLRKNVKDDYSDQKIEETLMKKTALLRYDKSINAADIISDLNDSQHANGSFGKGIHATALAYRLITEMENSSCLLIEDMSTKFSNTETKYGKPVTVEAVTTVKYQAPEDKKLTMQMIVTNGETEIYNNVQSILLGSDADNKEITAGSFELNEEKDNGIIVSVSLLDGETVLQSERTQLHVEEGNKVYATQINGLQIMLDKYCTYTGIPVDLNITGTILYASNTNSDADVTVKLKKDDQVLEEKNISAILKAEQNSVSVKPENFRIDALQPCRYVIECVCTDNGKEICSAFEEFNVIERPADTDNNLRVLWFQPIPDNLAFYAGKEQTVNCINSLIYDSDTEWNGTTKISVSFEDEIIAESSAPVALAAQDIDSMDTFYGLPKYESDTLVTFSVKKTGVYTVTGELIDAEGKTVATGTRKVTVQDKPHQDLILSGSLSDDGSVSLRWNDISNEAETYDYQLLRRIPGNEWETRSIWNESEHIDVLNVYPTAPYLAQWMTLTIGDSELPAGKGIFQIDSVHIDTYNKDPESYMINENGSWKYDVIFFGSSDCNSRKDLSDVSREVVQKFIDDGRGVLFGHDTICPNFNHYNFTSFADQLGIIAKRDSSNYATNSVTVQKTGTLTNYPWTIRGTLTVPSCHSYGQYVGGTLKGKEWMTLNAKQLIDEETGAHSNFYLVTNNNLGMIQTGHSTGKATDDERKVLANTLFYLYQSSKLTDAKDASFYDVTPPDSPDAEVSTADGKVQLHLSSTDHGTEYEYSIAARPASEDSESQTSNIIHKESFSGMNGFVIGVNNSTEPGPDLITRDENNEYVLNVRKANENGSLTIDLLPEELGIGNVFHIFAVDNANNISEEVIIPVTETLSTALSSDKQLYKPGDTVTLNALTTALPLNITADATVSVYEASGTEQTIIFEEPETMLNAGEKHDTNCSWMIPEKSEGRFRAVITWTSNGEELAKADTYFRVGEASVSNDITTDRNTYSITDPVNLNSKVFNRSISLTENDLTLSVEVKNEDNTSFEQFTHEIYAINQNGSISYDDAISPLKLRAGNYTVTADVIQDGIVISSANTTFTVEQTPAGFAGTLNFTPDSDKKVRTDFTVTNQGNEDIEEAEISVIIYQTGKEAPAYTLTKQVSLSAGSSNDFSDIISPGPGDYYGVLTVSYAGNKNDLDYDGISVKEEKTTVTNKTTSKVAESSPKTGDSGIMIYCTGALLSLTGLFALYVTGKKGGKKENE